jgi:hypothetical protein
MMNVNKLPPIRPAKQPNQVFFHTPAKSLGGTTGAVNSVMDMPLCGVEGTDRSSARKQISKLEVARYSCSPGIERQSSLPARFVPG